MAAKFGVSLCLVLYFVSEIHGLGLPSYIKPCSKSDPNLNECALKHAQEAIPFIVKGDPKYHIPNMQPMSINEISISSNKKLTLNFTDVKIYGLEGAIVKDIKIDLKNRKNIGSVFIPNLSGQGHYDMKGQILLLPINGSGEFNISTIDTIYTFEFEYEFETKNGKEYARITKSNLSYDPTRVYFHLDNLFNDPAISAEMNKVLNENWKDVHKDLGPAVSDSVNVIMKAIYAGVMERVPFEDVYLP